MDELVIRPAKKEDHEAVMNLYGLFVENQDRYKRKNADSYTRVLADKHAHIDVAMVNNKHVGFICYSLRNVIRYPKPIVEVEEFFVLEDYRRMKIGKKLMDRVLLFAQVEACEYIFLASSKERVAAHKFYKNYDFDEYALHFRRKI